MGFQNDLKGFIKAALIRALRTGAQTALGFLAIGAAISDVDWTQMLSVSVVAMVFSILTSIVTKLPELETQGEFVINDEDPDVTKWLLKYNGDPETIKAGDTVRFKVVDPVDGGVDDDID